MLRKRLLARHGSVFAPASRALFARNTINTRASRAGAQHRRGHRRKRARAVLRSLNAPESSVTSFRHGVARCGGMAVASWRDGKSDDSRYNALYWRIFLDILNARSPCITLTHRARCRVSRDITRS